MTNGTLPETPIPALLTTDKLVGSKVWMEHPTKNDADAAKKMGRVRSCVFHPSEPRCVGFLVKRPDVALMFHRRDLFVAIDGFELVDGVPLVSDAADATDKGACKRLGVSLDDCVLWAGLPVLCEDGTPLGLVRSVTFAANTGEVASIELTQGGTANVLLGKREVPADLVLGFRRGAGTQLTLRGATVEAEEDQPEMLGAILVSDRVKELARSRGVAEKAGVATAVAAHKVTSTVAKVKPKVASAASAAASTAGEAVNKGAFATGRQLKRASGMFSAFKEEFDKARNGDE